MSFVHPTYLWGLLGLLIPIVIHLWSIRKVKTILVGSTRFIKEAEPQQTRSIKLSEWWLLILRLLSIFFLVLILAKPHWKIQERRSELTYIIEPSLLKDKRIIGKLDTPSNVPKLVLSRGFPGYSKLRSGRVFRRRPSSRLLATGS